MTAVPEEILENITAAGDINRGVFPPIAATNSWRVKTKTLCGKHQIDAYRSTIVPAGR